MRRCLFGAGLLLGLLILCLTVDAAGRRAPEQISGTIRQAARAALEEDWEKTAALTEAAEADWKKTRALQSLLHHGEPVQRIDILFSQLEAFGAQRDPGAYGAVCLSLGARTERMAQE